MTIGISTASTLDTREIPPMSAAMVAGLYRPTKQPCTVRRATPADAAAIHALITTNLEAGRLLPRHRDEILRHVDRFVVATTPDAEGRVVACAELAPLGASLVEIRSLVVDARRRSAGIGRAIVADLLGRATDAGIDRVVAFTHASAYFTQMGFSVVPHSVFPEKIETDCRQCPQFRRCGQQAVVLPLSHGPASKARTHV